jgi:transposase
VYAVSRKPTAMGQERHMMQSKRTNVIAIDVHSCFCEGGWIDAHGCERGSFRVPTAVPALISEIERVPGPRQLIMEEGPLSDWLARHLREAVDDLVVCDPYRNALIAKEGEKSDPIDWRKLAQLCRGGYIRVVHHPQELERSLFKQHMQLYHDRVRHRVSEGLKVIWRVRRLGVLIREKDLIDLDRRAAMIDKMPANDVVREDLDVMLSGYDRASEQVMLLRRRLIQMVKEDPMMNSFCKLPGVGPIRAATIYWFIDTPFRFKTKQKLWKYMGIGLEKRQSGHGRVLLRVPRRCNRVLKSAILGAAKSAAATRENPFADQYQRWLEMGCSPRIAKRNLARSLAVVIWGMWKSGGEYDPNLVEQMLARMG